MGVKVEIEKQKAFLTEDGKFAVDAEYLENVLYYHSRYLKKAISKTDNRFNFYSGRWHNFPLELNKNGLFITYSGEITGYKDREIYLKSFNVEGYYIPEQIIKANQQEVKDVN